ARVTRFSFIVYGDTRGRRDGVQQQYEHSLIVDSVLETIKRLASRPSPVRFVIQTGDAVVNGRDASQWNKSFVDLINRITTEGRVPKATKSSIPPVLVLRTRRPQFDRKNAIVYNRPSRVNMTNSPTATRQAMPSKPERIYSSKIIKAGALLPDTK